MEKIWFITGCSGGFGKLLAEAAAARGDKVVATARNVTTLKELHQRYPDTVRTVALDVTRADSIASAVADAEAAFGRLDVLVNNAGHGFLGAIEEGTADEYRPLFDVNVFGLIEMTRAALPLMRRTNGGRIVNLSSGAGIIGMGGHGYYNATKFAVEGLSEALAEEVAPLGIRVIIVEPGPFRTEFLGRSITVAKQQIEAYSATGGGARVYREGNDGRQPGDPHKAVAIMMQAIDAGDPPLHLPIGPRAYALAERKLAAFKADMEAWRGVAIATDFSSSEGH
ncbi:oxidoreductase [Paraburkholderia caribensis]|uniref:oxidoreductase n=1 Tax=Paraburkholderia caribensis TaxID=75105 RepID=UPI00078D2B61|nr:oxidoreductase [Paraburkholderia caribensis]AMV48311.1 dehydrogenase [Paraburkholderia caribensis]